jgi:hypothetical protein
MAMFDDQSQQGGLLGFMSTPAGQGLLSAVATGLATARRGRPLNNIGSGLLGGVQGYQQATENQNTNSLKNIQLQQAQQAMERQKQILELQKRFATPAGGAAMGAVAAQGNTPGGFDGDGNYTAPVNNLGPTNAAAAVAPQTKPGFDYAGYSDALASIDPNAALAMKASLLKDSPFNKIDLKDVDPASAEMFRKTGNYGDLKIRSKKEFAPNGRLVDVYSTPQGSAFSDPNKPFTTGQNGEAVPNLPYQNFEIRKAGAGASRTNVSVDAAPKAFWSDFGKTASEQLFSERTAAQSAASTLQSIGEIRKAVAGGAYQGAGADMKLSAAKALGAIGLQIDPQTVANTEKFNAVANGFVLEKIKTLGTNPSNADREFIEKTVPRLNTDPNALPSLLNFMEQKARTQVQAFNAKIKSVQQQPGAGFMPFSLDVPEFPAAVGSPLRSDGAQPSDSGVKRYNPDTGRIE